MEIGQSVAQLAESIAQRVVEAVRQRQVAVTATYRLQLHSDFTFRDAAAILPYLKELGVSHVYCSPYLRAQTGSRHGYDLCDPTQFNPELGGEEGFREFTAALRAQGIGQILDIVPNHMAASLQNPWWYDVLENGPVSPYSHFFDIDWKPIKQELADKVLLPILGRQYGEALEEGQLKLEYHDGAFSIRYFEHAFPMGPRTTIPLLTHHLSELQAALGETDPHLTELESIITALEHLPPQTARAPGAVRERQREKEIIKRRLRDLTASSEPVRAHILRNVEEYCGDPARPESFDPLDRLLDAQPYRLSHWRSAADEINYRRFFDINDLAATCMETPEVFHCTHALLRPYLADGTIDGLRIDHVDGLYDPEQYLWRLQWAYLADLGERCFREQHPAVDGTTGEPAGAGNGLKVDWLQIAPQMLASASRALGLREPAGDDLHAVLNPDPTWEAPPPALAGGVETPHTPPSPLFVLVEKILGPDEPLPESWPVAGTSGYDFLTSLNGLFVAPQGYAEIVKLYDRFNDTHSDLHEIEVNAKLLILRVAMASELQMLAHRLNRISEQHRRSRDFTLNNLRLAIREVLACFPVYRVYPGKDGISDRDRKFVNLAISRARRKNAAFDPAVFEFLRSVLLLTHPPGLSHGQIAEREIFTGKFQQVTSPVMAKGVEDTAFYAHVPLVSVNEVGSDPQRPITQIAEFHESNRQRNHRLPQAMLASSTHDTKRSEDVRSRLHVLSELPRVWRAAVNRFARTNKRLIREVDGEPAPSRNDQYLFYQSLLGIWPVQPPDADALMALSERLTLYMAKATREAKLRTNWINPNEDYDAAMRDFVIQTLSGSSRNRFLKDMLGLYNQVATAGQCNALGQLALKLLSPGVPDVYQGQELWDYSLVDPDNRRPVDYELRRRLLAEIRGWDDLSVEERGRQAIALGHAWDDPRLKLLVTHRLLMLRRAHGELFSRGEYVPLETTGSLAQHVLALGWRTGAREPLAVVAVVPLQVQALLTDAAGETGSGTALWAEGAWADTQVLLPEGSTSALQCIFTGRSHAPDKSGMAVASLLEEFPLAVLRPV